MPNVKFNDTDIYFEIHGEGNPLLLITGFGTHLESWRPIIDKLKKKNQIIIFDNRGAGRTKCNDKNDWTIESMAKDSIDLLNYLKITKTSILGHSMGGAIAQKIAMINPELTDKLILSSTTAKFNYSFCMAMDFMVYLSKTDVPIAKQAKNIFSWMYSPSFLENKKARETLLDSFINNPYIPSIEDIRSQAYAIKTFNSQKKLNKIKSKTLILRGEQDIVCQIKETNTLIEEIEDASYYCIKNSGHTTYVEYPSMFTKIAIDFINENIK